MAKKIKDEATEAKAITTMEIAAELRAVTEQIIDAGGEITEGQFLALKSWQEQLEVKGQHIAHILEKMTAEAGLFAAIEERARSRRKAIENSQARLKEYLAAAMQESDIKSIKEKGIWSITLCDGRASVQIDNPDKLEIGRFAKIVESIQPDKDAIKAALDAGEDVAGAHVEYGKPYLMIR